MDDGVTVVVGAGMIGETVGTGVGVTGIRVGASVGTGVGDTTATMLNAASLLS